MPTSASKHSSSGSGSNCIGSMPSPALSRMRCRCNIPALCAVLPAVAMDVAVLCYDCHCLAAATMSMHSIWNHPDDFICYQS